MACFPWKFPMAFACHGNKTCNFLGMFPMNISCGMFSMDISYVQQVMNLHFPGIFPLIFLTCFPWKFPMVTKSWIWISLAFPAMEMRPEIFIGMFSMEISLACFPWKFPLVMCHVWLLFQMKIGFVSTTWFSHCQVYFILFLSVNL